MSWSRLGQSTVRLARLDHGRNMAPRQCGVQKRLSAQTHVRRFSIDDCEGQSQHRTHAKSTGLALGGIFSNARRV
jgi:hypothetical protein